MIPVHNLTDHSFKTHSYSSFLILKKKWGSWDHVAVCLPVLVFICASVCSSLSLCVSPVIFFVGRLMESPFCLCNPLFFVFYAVRVVWKESRRLLLPRTSCNIIFPSPCRWDCSLASLKMSHPSWTHYAHYCVHMRPRLVPSVTRRIQSIISHTIPLRSILVWSFHLRLRVCLPGRSDTLFNIIMAKCSILLRCNLQ
jgi:hypothetical protein